MNNELALYEALDDCLGMLRQGQSISDCLRRYPQYAAQLRPLLETADLTRRSHDALLGEATAARERGRSRLLDALREAPPSAPRRTPPWVLRLAASFAGALLLAGVILAGSLGWFNPTPSTPTPEPTDTATVTPTQTPTVTLTQTATVTATLTPSPTVSPTATATPSPSATVTATEASASSGGCVVSPPPSWVEYTIRSGDTYSGLAVGTATTIDLLLAVNCITIQTVLLPGNTLYLPRQPDGVTTGGSQGGSGGTGGTGGSPGGVPPAGDDDDDFDDDDD